MKKKSIPLTVVLILLSASQIHAQEICGTWQNSQQGITMVLNQNGSFDFKDVFGKRSGSYRVRGKLFSMRDQTGQTTRYTIQYLSDTVLYLVDDNGALLSFVRIIGENDRQHYEKYLLA